MHSKKRLGDITFYESNFFTKKKKKKQTKCDMQNYCFVALKMCIPKVGAKQRDIRKNEKFSDRYAVFFYDLFFIEKS